ncbi:hypothetical protein KTR10_03535 [Candidatus Kaiserbacteria bacterium]|nr:hypothetical protein [Candidatus Kaiserbacteria bacterium]
MKALVISSALLLALGACTDPSGVKSPDPKTGKAPSCQVIEGVKWCPIPHKGWIPELTDFDQYKLSLGCKKPRSEAWYVTEANGNRTERYIREWPKDWECADFRNSSSDEYRDYGSAEPLQYQQPAATDITTRWFPNYWNRPTYSVRQREFIASIADPESYNRFFRIRWENWVSMLEVRLQRSFRDRREVVQVLSGLKEVKCTDQLLSGRWINRTDFSGSKNDLTYQRGCREGEYVLLDPDGEPLLLFSCGNISGDEKDRRRFATLEGSYRVDMRD